jgi:hypothetical protein
MPLMARHVHTVNRRVIMGRLHVRVAVGLTLLLWAPMAMAEQLGKGGSSDATSPAAAQKEEELYGVWTNKDSDGKETHSRWDFKPDGRWASFRESSYEEEAWRGTYTITKKWSDDKGNVWYHMTWKNEIYGTQGFGLMRVGDAGSTLEAAYSLDRYPEAIDRTEPFWHYAGIHNKACQRKRLCPRPLRANKARKMK